jgi:hypothetical protein
LNDLEAGAGKGLGDQPRIVDGGRKRAASIGALPDHERETILGRRHGRRAEGGRNGKAEKNDSTFQTRHGSRTLPPALRAFTNRKGQGS